MKLDEADRALLDQVVETLKRYHMVVPGIFMLEAFQPLALVGSSAMVFLAPVVSTFIAPGDYDRVARLLGRRDVLEWLVRRLEREA